MKRLISLTTTAALTFWAGPTVEYKEKLLIKPSKESIEKVTRKISDVIKRAKAWKQENLINALNSIIIGWSNYPRKRDGINCRMGYAHEC